MVDDSANALVLLNAFLRRYVEDRNDGATRSLGEYLRMFPGAEHDIAQAFVELERNAAEGAERERDRRVGHYVLEAEIGRGAQGIVYRAQDTILGRCVALKVMRRTPAAPDDTFRRFRREWEAVARLDHPGLCGVFEAGEVSDVAFVAMRLVEGATLAKVLDLARSLAASGNVDAMDGAMPESLCALSAEIADPKTRIQASIGLLEPIGRAIHAAHSAGVVHRDLKPQNIVIDLARRPVVTDFGLALVRDAASGSVTGSGDVLGTPAYMAPEQVKAVGADVGASTDVWALGVILYECLTLARPFGGPTRESLLRAIAENEPAPIRIRLPAATKDVAAVVSVALSKDVGRRYASAEAFADDLAALGRGAPVRARQLSHAERVVRWARRKPATASIVGVALLSACVAIASVVSAAAEAQRHRSELAVAAARTDAALDRSKLQELVREIDYFVIRNEEVPLFAEWLRAADALIARIPDIERTMFEVRRAALMSNGASGSPRYGYEQVDLNDLRRQLRDLEAAAESRGSFDTRPKTIEPDWAHLDEQIRGKRADIAERERVLGQVATFAFTSTTEQWHHAELQSLVLDLHNFAGNEPGRPTRARVARWAALAASVRERSIDAHRDEWTRVARLVDAWARPGGDRAAFEPIEGLVPLGPDPDSGLEEFAHLCTGDVPRRDPRTGRLDLTDRSGIIMVLIPPQRFVMGPPPDEPAHPHMRAVEIELDAFLMGKFEVSQSQWEAIAFDLCAENYIGTPRLGGGNITGRHPIEMVDWVGAKTWLRHVGLELPTEAQWECACRATSRSRWAFGDRVTELPQYGNVADQTAATLQQPENLSQADPTIDDKHAGHAPVGMFLPNRFGLHDMHGNVQEWCAEFYTSQEQIALPGDGYREPGASALVICRGGSFLTLPNVAQSHARNPVRPDLPRKDVGFRAAMRLPWR